MRYNHAQPTAHQREKCFIATTGTSQEAIQAHIDHFARLKAEIRKISSYSGSLTCPDEHGIMPSGKMCGS
ncbi:MAG: hypothetical protein JXA13_03375 [Anaerolineales bacterium]|nr:hypothetical protein [Anaerolineales bacterium]